MPAGSRYTPLEDPEITRMFKRLIAMLAATALATLALGGAAAPAQAKGAQWSMTTSTQYTYSTCYSMPTTGTTSVTMKVGNVSLSNSSDSWVSVLRHGVLIERKGGGANIGSHNVTVGLTKAQAGDVLRVRHRINSIWTGAIVRDINYDLAAVRGTWCRSGRA